MLIDTHCHLDSDQFASDRNQVIQRAVDAGVRSIVIPAVDANNWHKVKQLAAANDNFYYAVGIHPMFVLTANKNDIYKLESFISESINDPKLVAIGEIGLDFYLPELKTDRARKIQEYFYSQQLVLAEKFNLPVLLHVRRSQDILLKHLRKHRHIGGIAHAFNGSMQQAEQFLGLGFTLGVGGAMTFSRAKQIRRIITSLPIESFVLETDAPDMSPEWLFVEPGLKPRNEPAQVQQIAKCFADLRDMDFQYLVNQCALNAQRVLPKLRPI